MDPVDQQRRERVLELAVGQMLSVLSNGLQHSVALIQYTQTQQLNLSGRAQRMYIRNGGAWIEGTITEGDLWIR